MTESETMTYTEAAVWDILQLARGKHKAVSRDTLTSAIKVNDRHIREAVASLVVHYQKPIVSDYRNGGYFLPLNENEIEEHLQALHNHALSILKREAVFKKVTLKELLAEYQTELF